MSEHFFIIGAQRCGTTYLYHILDEHPHIEMAKPVRPEPKFFLRDDLDQFTLDDYVAQFFEAQAGVKMRGEKSTSYIESAKAAHQMKRWVPTAKILVSLREPIARAISNYHFTNNHGLETLPLEEAFRQEDERRDKYDKTRISASPYAYLQRGHYMNYIDVYRQAFGDDAIYPIIYEEFVEQLDPVQALYRWLGVDDSYEPKQLEHPRNASTRVAEDNLSETYRAELRQHFAPSTRRLEAFLGREITAWRT